MQGVLILMLVVGIGYAVVQAMTEQRVSVSVGDPAPDFTLRDMSGQEIRLADYKGKGVLLNLWASWCNPCVNELPLLNEAYKLRNVEMVAVNLGEDEETVRKFADRYELEFPILLDDKGEMMEQYRAVGLPLTVLIDERGNIMERHEGELSEMSDILRLMERIDVD